MTTSEYYGIVYHGGDLRGLGAYGRTESYETYRLAADAAVLLATQCVKTCGGSPTYDIFRTLKEDQK